MPPRSNGTVTLAPGGRLVVEADRGEVEIVGDSAMESVTYEAEGGRVDVGHGGDAARIEARAPRALRVRVPQRASVAFDGSASIRVRGIRGDVEADCGLGGIDVEDVEGDVRVDAGLGPVRVARVRGDVEVDAGAGSVRLEAIEGRVTVDSGAGSVRGSELHGEVVVDSGAGAVELEGVGAGRVVVDSGAGHVRLRFTRSPAAPARVDAGTGRIVLELAPDVAADVELYSRRGVVDVKAPPSLVEIERGRGVFRGRVNGGGQLIRVEAEFGPVELRVGEPAGEAVDGAADAAGRRAEPLPGEAVASAAASLVRAHATGDGDEAAGAAPASDREELELYVLRLVESGTIRADEAERLLAALRGEPLGDDTEEDVASEEGQAST